MAKEGKIKASENKAGDVEVKPQIEKLWAQYGRLQAEREQLVAILQANVRQLKSIQEQIAKLEQNGRN